jgi:hypothetical protein
MSEIDLLNLAQSTRANITGDFGQVITITFAMVIGIFYFLNQAKIGLKIFAYLIYSIGMFLYFGLMVEQTNVALGVLEALQALPADHISRPTAHLISIEHSWIATTESALITGGFWVLWLGVGYLLFFWKKSDHMPS